MTNIRRLALCGAAAISLGGCASALPPTAFASRGPELRPELFFAGETRSFGVLETRGGAPSRVFHVEGRGDVQPDGAFRLDQTVRFDGRAPEIRTWIMRRAGANGIRATLTDASGQVDGEAYGDLLHLHYRLRSLPLGRMEQWMYLQPDGRTVLNEGVATVAGVVAARLSERITHVTPSEARP